MQELHYRLLRDLKRIGIDVRFNLVLRPYSKTYYGRYNPNNNKVILYTYEDKECTRPVKYEDLLLTLVHESIHCLQWKNTSFVRRKGVMHDAEFHRLYNSYSDKAKSLMLLQEVMNDKHYSTIRN